MSFNKRFYSWDRIKEKLGSDFLEFDMWLTKPDAHILQDNESSDFFGAYFSLPDDLQRDLYESMKVEDESFIKDLIKCIKVVHSDKNEESHEETVKIYSDLFFIKWNDKATKYRNLIQK
jgi:hypothetical protein